MPGAPGAPSPTTASRASWSGLFALGPLRLPVKAYPALVVPSHGPLHQIHACCGERISQRKICPTHGELTADEIGKAFEYGPDDQLAFSAEELEALAPTDDKTIQIEHLLPQERFDLSLLSGRSLYLAAAHLAAGSAYAQAVVALAHQNLWAVGRVVLSEQRRPIAVRAEGRRRLLFVLHWPEHRRAFPSADVDVAQVAPAELRAIDKALLQLHQALAWETYRDEGADRLNALIEAKVSARRAAIESLNATQKGSKTCRRRAA
jgi:Ku protein